MNLAAQSRVMTLILVLASSTSVFGSPADFKYETTPDSKPFWVQGHLLKVKTPRGEAQAQFYVRFLKHHSKIFSVGNVLYQKLPIASTETNDDFAAKVTDQLRLGLGITSWHRRLVKSAVVWESNWGKGHQYIRLYIKRNPKTIEYAIATFRDTYAARTGIESEIIQMETLGIIPNGLKSDKGRVANFIKYLFGNEAEAQSIPGLPSIPGLDPGSLPGAAIPGTAGLTLTIPGLTDLSNNVNGFMGSVDNVNATLAAQMGQANATASAAVQQASRLNDTMAKAEQLAANNLKGGTLLKDAFLTGAGAALGAAAANLAVAGAQKLVTLIVAKLGHGDRDEEFANVKRVQDALDMYRSYGDEVIDYTRMVDAAADIIHNQKTFLLDSFKNDNIESGVLILQDKLAELNDKIDDSRRNGGDETERYNMRRDAANMEKTIDMLKNSSGFCGSLHELFNKMEEAEDKIADLTVQTLDDISKYYNDKKNFNEYLVKMAKKENTDHALAKEAAAQKSLIAADDKAGSGQLDDHHNQLFKDCQKILDGYRKKQDPHVSKDEVKTACANYFNTVGEASKSDTRILGGVQVPGFKEENLKAANEDLDSKYNFSNSVYDIYEKKKALEKKPTAFGSSPSDPQAPSAKPAAKDSEADYFNQLTRSQGTYGADVTTMKSEDEKRSLIIAQMRANQAAVTDKNSNVVAYEDPHYKNLREMVEGGKTKIEDACRQLNNKSAPQAEILK